MFKAFLSFDSFILPKISKVIYWIGLALIVIFAVVAMIGALLVGNSPYGGGNAVVAFVGALVGGVVGIIVWRIAVELWMVLFSIYDVLKEIRDQRR